MTIGVELTQGGYAVALEQPEDFERFKVVARGIGFDELGEALAPYGRLTDNGHALIELAAVRHLAAERGRRRDWRNSFETMVRFAARKGWISDDGDAIVAHCEIDCA